MAWHLLDVLECISSSCQTPRPLWGGPFWWAWVIVSEATGLFFESGGAGESHIAVTADKVHNVCTVHPLCLSNCHLGGRLWCLWEGKTLFVLSIHCYLSYLSIVPLKESNFVPQVMGQMLHNRLESLFLWRHVREQKRKMGNSFCSVLYLPL